MKFLIPVDSSEAALVPLAHLERAVGRGGIAGLAVLLITAD